MSSSNPFEYPGVDWPRIGFYLWITLVVIGSTALVVGVFDFFSARQLASLRPRQLRSAPVKRWREARRFWLARVTHPTTSVSGQAIEFVNMTLGVGAA
jgi:hypothetical protein